MDPDEFKEFAKAAIDYIVDYNENIRERQVLPSVEPGYLHKLMPKEVPRDPEHWNQILPDIEKLLMPGITHWNSPMFNAYYPAGNSYPSIVGEILSAGIGCVGFNWMTSPACTELEVIVLDWLAKLMNLPKIFLAESNGPGGGIIQGSGSEGILVALITAKENMVKRIKKSEPHWGDDDGVIKARLVAYTSDQSNSAIEKAGLLGSMKTRLLTSDANGCIQAKSLEKAIEEDRSRGLIPCFIVATLGTTATCAFDNLLEIGPICQKENIWLHVDAAYAGAAFICPEYHYLMAGIEYADSINMNPHKWLLVNFDCSAFWIKDTRHITDAFSIDRIYLRDKKETCEKWAPDFRNWEIPLGRRFRALKLWLTLRLYGVNKLQSFIKSQCSLAKYFESLVLQDNRFELICPASMGLVCFRGDDISTTELVKTIVEKKELYMNSAVFRGKSFIRYAICSRFMKKSDVEMGWTIITSEIEAILAKKEIPTRKIMPNLNNNREKKNYHQWEKVIEESLLASHG